MASGDRGPPSKKKPCLEGQSSSPNRWDFSKRLPHPFLNGDYGVGAPPLTRAELSMMQMSGSIRSKTDWLEKKKNPVILKKWKEEAIQQGLTEKQADYVIAELDYYAALRDGPVEPAAVDGVWQADGLILEELKKSLIDGVKKLEDIPEFEKDWHPGTNKQVLDLVHPSLYCVVYGSTRRTERSAIPPLEFIGTGEVIPPPNVKTPVRFFHNGYVMSTKYQWLPSEFEVNQTADNVEIKSYINNLHPEWHSSLYSAISAIFAQFVPLLNRVLTDLANPRPARIQVDPYNWYKDEGDTNEDDEDEEYGWGSDEWFARRELVYPEAPEFRMPDASSRVAVDLAGRTLQVIVKLANIELTPENPCYPGGSWHVEGMENEHIVASAIYYYSSENISESKLHFRQAVQEPPYEQGDGRGVREIFGLVDEGPLNQELGAVITREDRCIAFPNILQHRVAPFELQDKTKPGYRKTLVFFLVDPAERIISTLNVPPQQKSWLLPVLRNTGPFQNLPQELLEQIVALLPWPMSLEEAKSHREKLMEERKYFMTTNNEELFERPFSLCEH